VPKPELVKLLNHPARLAIMSIAANRFQVSFVVLKQELEVSDATLSKHIAQLSDAGYLRITKSLGKSYAKTTVDITSAGRGVYEGHVAALRAILGV
jgi:DNA-binding transcriptional ArsR family regulator